ncbi:MAG TPA: efflux RND transporter periplasmic adaptor subunit [Terriglobales bacterium]|nr:efflux RND transporter periplasmic adaptor subunit [Terriglobales bacterium]
MKPIGIQNSVTVIEPAKVDSTPQGPAGGSPVEPPSQHREKPRNLLTPIIVVLVVAVIVWGLWKLFSVKPAAQATSGAVVTVTRTDFVRTLRVQGTVEAISFYSVAAPRLSGPGMGSMIVTKLAPSGKRVKKGELLVEFDRQAQIRNALDRQAEFVDFEQQIRKMKADHAALKAADETALKQAENTMKSAQLELRRNEIVSRIDAEKNQQNYDEAKATYEQLKTSLDLKRKANLAELRSMEIQRDRARAAMEYAENNSKKLQIVSPLDGINVLNSIWKGGQMGEIQEGDEVRPGVPFMQVVNPGAMQVRSKINQADITNLSVGQAVKVGLDAYPDLTFVGKIERIAALGVTSGMSQKVRTFQAVFSIVGSDAKLMPDLSAAVDVELERFTSVLVVPRDYVFYEGEDAYLQLENGQQKKVKIKAFGDDQVVIDSGIDEGAKIVRRAG